MSDYWKKLQDPRWQRKRLEVMQRASFACEACDDNKEQLNVHHLYYVKGRNPWEYPAWSLQCLCKTCHQDIHDSERSELDSDDTIDYDRLYFEQIMTILKDSEYRNESFDYCVEYGMSKQYLSKEHFHLWLGHVLHYGRQLREKILTEGNYA